LNDVKFKGMANTERRPFLERAAEKFAEFSKKVDTILIAAGAGIYVLVNTAVGAAIVIGSVITIVPAQAFERFLKKRRARAA